MAEWLWYAFTILVPACGIALAWWAGQGIPRKRE
jgi:hypothetical protein